MADPAITFAIPYYSNLGFLKRAIDSVLGQTLNDWRIVVCDDCNPLEPASDLVAEYNNPRISYHRNPQNLGIAGNWNRCISLARTELVTLLHADDELRPEYTRIMLDLYRAYPTYSAYFCRADIIDADSRPKFSFPDYVKRFLNPCEHRIASVEGEQGLVSLLKGSYIMCPSVCYNRAHIEDECFSSKWQMVLDLDFFSGLLFKGKGFIGTPEVGYAYRRHENNYTVKLTSTMRRFNEEIELYDLIGRTSVEKNWFKASSCAKKKSIIKLHLAYLILRNMSTLKFGPVFQEIECLMRIL
ncbi:MAG: glycosyltransferase family 2 protein [Oligoflexales bacterium]|nr:glycosyltransferase family 2 protein [Oligoflexales bacterium]